MCTLAMLLLRTVYAASLRTPFDSKDASEEQSGVSLIT